MDTLLNSVAAPAKNQNPGQVIEISHLRKGFGTQEVLKDVSLKL
jgi:ABC-type transporter Mla maintaining outer membrane lipid asymmetry ATPase subunit MlaF